MSDNCNVTTTEVQNILSSSGDYVVLSSDTPYEKVQVFTSIIENVADSGTGTIMKKEFRYSIDNKTFSEFQILTIENLIEIGSFDQIYVQFRFILLSGGPVTISNITLNFTPTPPDNSEFVPANIEDESRVYAYPVIYKSNFL